MVTQEERNALSGTPGLYGTTYELFRRDGDKEGKLPAAVHERAELGALRNFLN
jgi:hypothetical protein